MRYTKAQISHKIDYLAALRAQQSILTNKSQDLVLAIKEAGGGESKRFRALLVRMPKKTVVVKAHKQVRLYAKSH